MKTGKYLSVLISVAAHCAIITVLIIGYRRFRQPELFLVSIDMENDSKPASANLSPEPLQAQPKIEQASAPQPEPVVKKIKPIVKAAPIEKIVIKNIEPESNETTGAAITENPSQSSISNSTGSNTKALTASYYGVVLARLTAAKRYPARARKLGIEGTVQISFNVMPTGQITDISILTPSSSDLLNDESLELPSRVNPLPAPPAELLRENKMSFKIPVRYELR